MDPQANLRLILESLRDLNDLETEATDGIRQDVSICLDGLARWLDSGGYLPDVRKAINDVFTDELANDLTKGEQS